MDFQALLKLRRSTRRYLERQITGAELDAILLAAHSSPVGSALYGDIRLLVLRERAVMELLARACAERAENKAEMERAFGKSALKPASEPSGKRYDPFYGAPTAIIISHRKQTAQPGIEYANAAVIAHAMHLAATSLSLGSVLLWFVTETIRERPELKLESKLGLPEDFSPVMGLAVGYPARVPSEREPRTDRIPVDYL